MKNRKFIILSILIALIALAIDAGALEGKHSLQINVYDAQIGGTQIWSKSFRDVDFIDGRPTLNPISIVRAQDLGFDIVYLDIKVDGESTTSSRVEVSMPGTLHRELDAMDMGIEIGEPGNDVGIRSDRLIVGDGDPNERVTVEGALSMEETPTPPSSLTGYGKMYVDSDDSELYFVRSDGSIEILSIDDAGGASSGLMSIETSDRDSAMTGLLRLEPGEGTEITETMEGDTGVIIVRFTGDCGSGCTAAPAAPTFIDGNALACSGEPGTSYSTQPVPSTNYYRWTLPSGSSILDGSGTNAIRVMFGNTDGNLCVSAMNDCGSSSPFCIPITINRPTSPGPITGSVLVCRSETSVSYNIATVPDATNYSWTVPPGASIVSGSSTPTIVVNFGTSPGEVCVRTENSCGISDPVCLTVDMTWTPSTPGAITGTSDVCPGESGVTYSISPVAEATSYSWTIPSGATISSGAGTEAIDIDFGSSGGNVCVDATSICGTSSDRCFTVNMMSPPNITAHPSPTTVDEGDPATFSITASGDGLTYQWQQSTDGGSLWGNIGSGGTSYSIGATTDIMDGYQYRCIVTGTCTPPETSSVATLTVSSGLYEFTSHIFTNAGATGRTGPSLTQCRSAYSPVGAWDDNTAFFNVSSGIQLWTVPTTGTYRIEVWGAQGGGSRGGRGARMRGDFNLTEGDQLKILVGQQGEGASYSNTGGGGGSYVTTSSNSPLIIAGGGGGASTTTTRDQHGRTATTGGTPYCYSYCGTPGSGGSGGGNAAYPYLGGPGGLTGNGASGSYCTGGLAFTNGGTGGSGDHWGGFGGGGSSGASGWDRAGGGGGYSGGGSGLHDSSGSLAAGGGGSYNDGASQSNSSGIKSGHGEIKITFCPSGDCTGF